MRFSSVTIRPNGSDNLTLVSQEAGTMMDKCFCKELAMQTSTKWMSSAHVNGSEDPKYVNKYIRSRVGDLDNDDPFDKNKGLLKT